ncbi:MAG: zinc ribbon domain-containing protein [Lachnospiraceae bacterium]|nr:zinc ribbon domain-containing protein [Lachnospiraceae bacterium]
MARFCNHCGREVRMESKFCPGCGKELKAFREENTETMKQKFCTNCGKPLMEGALFCVNCGSVIKGKAVNAENEKTDVTTKPEQSKQAAQTTQKTLSKQESQTSQEVQPKQKKKSGKAAVPVIIAAVGIGIGAVAILAVVIIVGIVIAISRPKTPGHGGGNTGEYGSEYKDNSDLSADYGDDEIRNYYMESEVSYSSDEIKNAPAKTASVGYENTLATLDGMTVDFGDANFDEGEEWTFTVRELPEKTDSNTGETYKTWDFDLEDKDSFDFYVDVTVPYGDVEDPYMLTVKHYDEELGMWEYVPYEIDEENGEITFSLNHFSLSSICSAWMQDREEALSEMDELSPEAKENHDRDARYLTTSLSPAKIDKAVYNKVSDEQDLGLINEIYTDTTLSWIDDFSKNYGDIITTSGITLDWLDIAGYGAYVPEFVKVTVGDIGSAFTNVRLISKFIKSGSISDFLKKNWKDLLGIVLGAGAKKSPQIMVLKAAVDSFFFAEEKVSSFQNNILYNGKSNAVEDVYYQFTHDGRVVWLPSQNALDYRLTADDNTKIKSKYSQTQKQSWVDNKTTDNLSKGYRIDVNNIRTFYLVMNKIQNDYPDNPEVWMDKFDQFLEQYADYFWTLPQYQRDAIIEGLSNARSDTNTAYGDTTSTKAATYTYTEEERENYTSEMIKSIKKELADKKFYDTYLKQAEKRSMYLTNQMVAKYNNHLNSRITFKLVMTDKNQNLLTFDKSEYKDSYIIMDPTENNSLGLFEPWEMSKTSTDIFDCTYLSYCAAGFPTKILIYKSKEAYQKKENPVKTLNFTVVEDQDEVIVTVETKEVNNYEGYYKAVPGGEYKDIHHDGEVVTDDLTAVIVYMYEGEYYMYFTNAPEDIIANIQNEGVEDFHHYIHYVAGVGEDTTVEVTGASFDPDSKVAEYEVFTSRYGSDWGKSDHNESYKISFMEENGEVYVNVEVTDESKWYDADKEGNLIWNPDWDGKETYTFSGKRVKLLTE